MNKWYLGAQNDGLFIIDQPPRPSNDHPVHDARVNVIAAVPDGAKNFAEAVVAAHNSAMHDVPKWISVKDRLPIEDVDLKDGYNSVKVIVSRGQVVHDCEYVAWGKNCNGSPNQFNHDGRDYITHWMSLPLAAI